jgi:TRAP-type C4-dicarboxylate transport system permease small subunit
MSAGLAEGGRQMRKAKAVLTAIERVLEWMGMLILAVMLGISLVAIFARDVLVAPLSWSLDLSLMLMIWMTMLLAGAGLRTDLHIRVEFFAGRLPPLAGRIVSIAGFALMFFFGYEMLVQSIPLVRLPGIMPELGLRNSWLFVPVLLGGLTAMLYSLERIAGTVLEMAGHAR